MSATNPTLEFGPFLIAAALGAALLAAPPLAPAALAETLVVANKSDATVDLIDLASGRSVAKLPTGHGPHEVAVSPDGTRAAVSNYGDRGEPGSSLTLVDVAGARVFATIPLGPGTRPHGLAWISDRLLAVTAEGTGQLIVVDVTEREVRGAVETGQEVSHMVAVTPDGRRAFVANIGSGSVTVIDLERGEKIADVATGAGAEGIAVTPDGREVWVGNRAADTLTVLDAATLETLATVPCGKFPIRVAITPDGSRVLVSAAVSAEVVVFDRAIRRELARVKLELDAAEDAAERLFGSMPGSAPVGLVVAPDGSAAWVAATRADVVARIGLPAGEALAAEGELRIEGRLEAGREPDGMGWSPLAVER